MSITFNTHLSGEVLGQALVNEPEDLGEVLLVMSKTKATELGPLLAGYLYGTDATKVATFLQALARQIAKGATS